MTLPRPALAIREYCRILHMSAAGCSCKSLCRFCAGFGLQQTLHFRRWFEGLLFFTSGPLGVSSLDFHTRVAKLPKQVRSSREFSRHACCKLKRSAVSCNCLGRLSAPAKAACLLSGILQKHAQLSGNHRFAIMCYCWFDRPRCRRSGFRRWRGVRELL